MFTTPQYRACQVSIHIPAWWHLYLHPAYHRPYQRHTTADSHTRAKQYPPLQPVITLAPRHHNPKISSSKPKQSAPPSVLAPSSTIPIKRRAWERYVVYRKCRKPMYDSKLLGRRMPLTLVHVCEAQWAYKMIPQGSWRAQGAERAKQTGET